jgi:alcohol dehydrogenase (cytochrome c)
MKAPRLARFLLRGTACVLAMQMASAGAFAASAVVESAGQLIPGDDWRGYNKTLDGQRFSPLDQINVENASSLKELCRVEIAHRGSFQSGPLVVDGTMYVTAEEQTVAVDPVTCAIRWRHRYHHEQSGISPMNRGVAYANGRLFRGTEDARVIALDARTGAEIWTSVAGDARLAEFIASAPVVWNGLVIVGTGGSEWGIKGRILAFDAQTGREIWRFSTIPTGHERGAETWKDGQWAEHGGGGTWSSFAIDPVTAEVFVPVANPVPDFAPQDRPGSNLFTDSVVVLDARTGALHWWYQLTPHDGMDWDLAAAPLLFRDRNDHDMLVAAGKDGYLHVVDRATHALKFKAATTTVDEKPAIVTPAGVEVCPGAAGGTLWNGPAYDPSLRRLFVGAIDMCAIVTSAAGQTYGTRKMLYGGTWRPTSEPATGWITAVDADTGTVRWKYHTEAPVLGALTPTAGGILMAGDNAGNFLVFDSATGKLLNKFATQGSLSGGVVTYLIKGRQYVAIDSGNISRTGFGAIGRPSVVIMQADLPPAAASSNAINPQHGLQVYQHGCLGCHATDGEGIRGFSLKNIKQRMNADQLISRIRNPTPPMPRVFPEPLDDDDLRDLRDLAAYLEQ